MDPDPRRRSDAPLPWFFRSLICFLLSISAHLAPAQIQRRLLA